MNIYRDYAEELIEAGYSVTPTKQNKAPVLARDWQKTTGETILLPKYNADWAQAKGLGLLCGRPSGIFCLDVDIRSDTDDTELLAIREKIQEMLPPIYSGRSGSKFKPPARLFRWNGEENEKFKAIDVEILSTGNQCVIPPSLHPEGHEYAWAGRAIHDCEPDDFPDLPDEVVAYLRETNLRRKGEFTPDKLLKSTPGRCKSGSHNYLSGIGVALRFANEKPRDIVNRLIFEDQKINAGEPSLYFLCKSRRWRSSEVIENAQSFVEEICKRNKPEPVHEKFPTLKDGFYWKIEPEEGTKQKVKYAPDYLGLANYFKSELFLKTRTGQNYIYNCVSYELLDVLGLEKEVLHVSNSRSGRTMTPGHLPGFLRYTKAVCAEKEPFINPADKLNMQNGILNTRTGILSHPDKNVFFDYQLPYNYPNELFKTPAFDEFMEMLTGGDTDKENFIREYIGYCLSGCDYSLFNKILVLDGDGSNGKTTLTNIIKDVVGAKNSAAESLSNIKDNRFAAHSLVGKRVNFCAEEPKSAFAENGALKKLTGNDPYMVEPKGLPSFQYINYAKFVISYNQVPYLPDRTGGMRRRLVIIPCLTNLEANPELKIDRLHERVALELGGIARSCLKAFASVQARGFFTSVKASAERFDLLARQSDPFLDFMLECVRHESQLSEQDRISYETVSTTSGAAWDNFEKFIGRGHKYSKRGFETRFGNYIKSQFIDKNLEVKINESGRPRLYSRVKLLSHSQ